MLLLNFIAGAVVYILGKFVAYSVDKWCCNEDTTDRKEYNKHKKTKNDMHK